MHIVHPHLPARRMPSIPRPLRIGAVALAILLACHSIAAAQSPAYTTRPRSNGGRAAGFGTVTPGRGPSRPSAGGSPAARSGVMNGQAGGGATAPRAGAPRPAIGSTAPSLPFKGGGPSTRSGPPRASGPGMQVFSAEQLKSGKGQPGGVGRRR